MNNRNDFYVLTKKEKDNALAASVNIVNLVPTLKDKYEFEKNIVSVLDNITHNATLIIETMTTDELLF